MFRWSLAILVFKTAISSGVGVRLKVGINIEKTEGVGSGEELCPPQLGYGGLPPEKKSIFALKYFAILSKFWYFFPILQHKVGDYPPVLKVGTYTRPPSAPTPVAISTL